MFNAAQAQSDVYAKNVSQKTTDIFYSVEYDDNCSRRLEEQL